MGAKHWTVAQSVLLGHHLLKIAHAFGFGDPRASATKPFCVLTVVQDDSMTFGLMAQSACSRTSGQDLDPRFMQLIPLKHLSNLRVSGHSRSCGLCVQTLAHRRDGAT